MPNYRSRGKFKRKFVNHPSLETPSDEMYKNSETSIWAYKMPKQYGWLRLDINLRKDIPVEDFIDVIRIRITEDRNVIRRELKARVLRLRDKYELTAPEIASQLHLPLHRVQNILYRSKKSVER